VRYAAPEVARSRLEGVPVRVTKAVDIWAMAMVLFHFFSGGPLWGDEEVDVEVVANTPEKAIARLEEDRALTDPQRRLIREMLLVDPAKRKQLDDVLAKGFFKEGEDTEQAKFIEVLALFSSPKQLRNGKGIPPLQLMREIVAMQQAIPRKLREIRPAARFPIDVEPVLRQLTPRIIQFSGHGDAVARGAYAGALAFEMPNGMIQLPDPQSFVELLGKEICPRLELVFLNGCKTLHPLGEQIVEALPHLTVIGWDSVTADNAASAFAQGFYDSVGRNCARGGGGGSKGNLMESFVSAERAFAESGFVRGDPAVDKGAHGAYGILGHALIARVRGNSKARAESTARTDSVDASTWLKSGLAAAGTGSRKSFPLPLLPEKGESTKDEPIAADGRSTLQQA